ncbi:MAG: fumarylacetoacetate hydrolase family protein [Sphingomonas sp.]|nr:fumarylacetoacetate hydrolase family protein [Sphingomonas sp.]
MRLVTFTGVNGERVGALAGEGELVDLGAAAVARGLAFPRSMQALIEAAPDALALARDLAETPPNEAILPLSAVTLLAPLPRPVRLRDCCLFLEHMEKALDKLARQLAAGEDDPEAALERLRASGKYSIGPVFRDEVIYYNADHLHMIGPDADIAWPSASDWMDYELEWACVIGPGGRDIPPERARDHIFGYTIFNDWSARDTQIRVMGANLGPGEGKDFANGLGPCIATPDEFDDPYALAMTAHVNGELWSRGSTASMHHRFEDAIVQFSRERDLHAGEVIGSGTVLSGCGFELDRRLAGGDLVELTVEGIGTLANRIVRR